MPSRKTTDPAKEKLQARVDEILALTTAFCQQHLDNEYAALCQKLIGKMSRKRASPFVAGRMDIWAGSVIYTIGQVNLLFDKGKKPYLNPDVVAEHFHTTKTTLGMRAKEVRDLFKLRRWDPEFSTRKTAARDPFAGLFRLGTLVVHLPMPESPDQE